MANRAQRTTFVGRHHALRGIFHDEQIVFFRQRHDGVHLAGYARVVHRHDSAGFIGDGRFNQRLIDIHGLFMHVDKHNFRAAQHKGVGGRDKGVTRHNHFITRLDIQQDRRHFQ